MSKPRGTSALREAAGANQPQSAAPGDTQQAFVQDAYREKVNRLHQQVIAMEPELAKMLPPGVDPGGFAGAIWGAILANPKLIDADRATLLVAARRAAQDGLIPDGREAVFSIYSTNVGTKADPRWIQAVQYMPMVEGIVKALYASGEVTLVDGVAVYESEVKSGAFKYRRGDSASLEHEPDILSPNPGPIVAAYAVIKLRSGEIKREVLPLRDIEKIRAASRNAGSGPWVDWPDQMAIKAVLHRVRKQLPRSPRFTMAERVLDADLEASGFREPTQQQPEPRAAIAFTPGQTMDEIIGTQQQRAPATVPATQTAQQPPATPSRDAPNGQDNKPASVAPAKTPSDLKKPEPASMADECVRNAEDSKSEDDLALSYDILRHIPAGEDHQRAVAAIKRAEVRIFGGTQSEQQGAAGTDDEIV